MLEELDTGVKYSVSYDYYQKHFLSEDKAGEYGPLMRAAKQAEILDLLVTLHSNTTVTVNWSEDQQAMNMEAINNLLRSNKDVLLNALQVYGFDSYEDAMEQLT